MPEYTTSNLPPGVTDTFTRTCLYGCTIEVRAGQEQPHTCEAVSVIADACRSLQPDGATVLDAAQHIADKLAPLVSERSFDVWVDGVRSGRSGLCYGVPEDNRHTDDADCFCGPEVELGGVLTHHVGGLGLLP